VTITLSLEALHIHLFRHLWYRM